MKAVPCLCCGQPMEVAVSKPKGKPYLSCEGCGVQTFVRGKAGVQQFEGRYGADWKGDKPADPVPAEPAKKEPAAPTPTKGGRLW